MNNTTPPKFFYEYCRICGFTEEKILDAWKKVMERSAWEFGQWFVKNEVPPEKANAWGDSASVNDLLKDLPADKKEETYDKMVEFLGKNLDAFYTSLKKVQSVEQKQVANAYVATSK